MFEIKYKQLLQNEDFLFNLPITFNQKLQIMMQKAIISDIIHIQLLFANLCMECFISNVYSYNVQEVTELNTQILKIKRNFSLRWLTGKTMTS